MKKIIALNHKMNLLNNEVEGYINSLNDIKTDHDIIIIPSNIYLSEFVKKAKFMIGSQNVYKETKGAYTGEISPLQLKSLGVLYTLIGHSERRSLFKENNELVKDKVKCSLENGVKVILCVGETLAEKEAGKTYDIIDEQLRILSDISVGEIIIAYEPVWSIGTGLIPELAVIEEVSEHINNYLKTISDASLMILYGGSVNDKNIKEITALDYVDGVLVGGASLKEETVKQMILNIN